MRRVALRKIERLGRITIPKPLKELAGIADQGWLQMELIERDGKPSIAIRMADASDFTVQ